MIELLSGPTIENRDGHPVMTCTYSIPHGTPEEQEQLRRYLEQELNRAYWRKFEEVMFPKSDIEPIGLVRSLENDS